MDCAIRPYDKRRTHKLRFDPIAPALLWSEAVPSQIPRLLERPSDKRGHYVRPVLDGVEDRFCACSRSIAAFNSSTDPRAFSRAVSASRLASSGIVSKCLASHSTSHSRHHVQTARPSDNGAVFSRVHCSHPIKKFLADHKPGHFAIRCEKRRSKSAQKPP
jgi:hypothetical protein